MHGIFRFIPCPSMSPKLFWIRSKNDCSVFTTEFHILKNVWSCPKQFGQIQKRFGPIEEHVSDPFLMPQRVKFEN